MRCIFRPEKEREREKFSLSLSLLNQSAIYIFARSPDRDTCTCRRDVPGPYFILLLLLFVFFLTKEFVPFFLPFALIHSPHCRRRERIFAWQAFNAHHAPPLVSSISNFDEWPREFESLPRVVGCFLFFFKLRTNDAWAQFFKSQEREIIFFSCLLTHYNFEGKCLFSVFVTFVFVFPPMETIKIIACMYLAIIFAYIIYTFSLYT